MIYDLVKIDSAWKEFIDAVDEVTVTNDPKAIDDLIKSYHPDDREAACLAVTLAKWNREDKPYSGGTYTCGACMGKYTMGVNWEYCQDCPLYCTVKRELTNGAGCCSSDHDAGRRVYLETYLRYYKRADTTGVRDE
ncbi:MAG: hypothetical protein DRJ03_11620 [Chloroflexi bacterium]|nr:MAG: hypothetical protein DRJ03_11620 [Chloroflexota bacterium]